MNNSPQRTTKPPEANLLLVLILGFLVASCSSPPPNEAEDFEAQWASHISPLVTRLLGNSSDYTDHLRRLIAHGELSDSELTLIEQANNDWFQERKPRVDKAKNIELKYNLHVAGQVPQDGVNSPWLSWVLAQEEFHDPLGYDAFEFEFRKPRGFMDETKYSGMDLSWGSLTRATADDKTFIWQQHLFEANFSRNLRPGAQGAGFTRLDHSNLVRVRFGGANFSEAILDHALAIGVQMESANLKLTSFIGSDLRWSSFERADASGANFDRADVRWADFSGADLSHATFRDANLDGVIFEPKPEGLPDLSSLVYARNIERMVYRVNPGALLALRESFKKDGLFDQENAVRLALKRSEQKHALSGSLGTRLMGFAWLMFFDWTSAYGSAPLRPLVILLTLIPLFALLYAAALSRTGPSGIWAQRTPGWLRSGSKSRPVRITCAALQKPNRLLRLFRLVRLSCYFSLLQAFRVGFHEANIGDWIERIQAREYSLRATGWVRSVAGIQSLISVYLLALCVLTLFGRPFD